MKNDKSPQAATSALVHGSAPRRHRKSQATACRYGKNGYFGLCGCAACNRPKKDFTDTDRLNALFTVWGGNYCFAAGDIFTQMLGRGRDGIDQLILENPSLLVSPNIADEPRSPNEK